MFYIDINKLYWIDGSTDNPDDLCLHGDITAKIGSEQFETSCTVSASALYLLKSLVENHFCNTSIQLFPCCGNFFISDKNNSSVEIIGCDYGIDLNIIHKNDHVIITTEKGADTIININDYRKAVFNFADEIEKYYHQCLPKNISLNEFSRNGYIAFWNEWHIRRGYGYNCLQNKSFPSNRRLELK